MQSRASPGPRPLSRAKVASARDLFRATRTIRAPIWASASAAISPIPDVPPVMTTVFSFIAAKTDVFGVPANAMRQQTDDLFVSQWAWL